MKKRKHKISENINEKMLYRIKRKKRLKLYKRIKKFLLLFIIIILISTYFQSDISKVKSLEVNENQFYSKEEILNIAELDFNTYFLTPSIMIVKKLEKDPLISKAEVKKDFNGTIEIKTTEAKAIGYLNTDTKSVLIQGEGLNKIKKYNNLKLPKINNFNEEQLMLLDDAFKDVEKELISMISEIIPHRESYNDNMVMMIMNNGDKVISSYNGVYLLNSYKLILPKLTGDRVCLYLDDVSGNIIKQTECNVSNKNK